MYMAQIVSGQIIRAKGTSLHTHLLISILHSRVDLQFCCMVYVLLHWFSHKKRRSGEWRFCEVWRQGDACYVTDLLLMGGAKEVVDGLDGVECRGGDFDEDCRPVAHGAVPQTGELESLKFAAGK